MTDLKEIRLWSDEKKTQRLKCLGEILRDSPWQSSPFVYPEEAGEFLDEAIVIALEALKKVSSEQQLGISATDLFESVFLQGLPDIKIREWLELRFRETLSLVSLYRSSSKIERSRLRSKLSSRGML